VRTTTTWIGTPRVFSRVPVSISTSAVIPGRTAGTSWSVSYSSNPGITSGDHLVLGGVWSTDAADTVSASAFAATGATIAGIVAAGDQNPRVTTGSDLGGNTNHCNCSAGTASANGTWTSTHTLATNNSGSAVLVRIREVTPPAARSPYVIGANANRRASQWR